MAQKKAGNERAPAIAVSIFDDTRAKRVEAKRLTAQGLERLVRGAEPVATKESARLLKLAEFGDEPSERGSLRHDANVRSITGVIADYDGGVMTLADAAQRLETRGIAAVLYTTASHAPERPRWRAIAFLSQPLAGNTEELRQQHRHWTGVLNAILGGVLKSESFALSQSYYFGPIQGRSEPEVTRLSGLAIDAIANLPDPVYPSTMHANGADPGKARDESRSADLYDSVYNAVAGLLWDDARIHERFDDHPHAAGQRDPHRAVQRCIDKVRAKYPRPAFQQTDSAEEEWKPPAVVAYGSAFDPTKIPPRRWLLGKRRSVGEVTADIGPPGVNKSMLMLTDAVAIATGRKLLADEVHEQGGVVYLAGEDARRDVEARLAGILSHYQIRPAELGGRLRCVYLGEISARAYTLAEMARDVAVLNQRMLGWLADYEDTIAVFLDPIAAWHRLIENNNGALDLLCTSLRAVAVQGTRHVGFDHHPNKASMTDHEAHVGNLAAVRGASTIITNARWMFTMARLNPDTAVNFAIPERDRRRYRRLDSLKMSHEADDIDVRVLRVISVLIANGEAPGVLVEVDAARLREAAKDGLAKAEEERNEGLVRAFTKMLDEARPRSGSSAAAWLVKHCPELFIGKRGKPLTEDRVRKQLEGLIGSGIRTRKGTIKYDPSKRGASAAPIDYAPKEPK